MNTIMQNITVKAAGVRLSAKEHVAALVLAGITSGVSKVQQRNMWEAATDGGLNSKTAYRHISFAVAVVNTIAKKHPGHAMLESIRTANSTDAKFAAVIAFFDEMAIYGAAEAEMWGKGDGLPLNAAKLDELRAEKAEKAKAEKATQAPLVPLQIEGPVPAEVSIEEPAMQPVGVESLAATLVANIGSLSDEGLAALAKAIMGEMKSRKAEAAKAAKAA